MEQRLRSWREKMGFSSQVELSYDSQSASLVPVHTVVELNELLCHGHWKCEHHVARMLAISEVA